MFDNMKITHTDGTVVECSGRNSDVVRFERQFKQPASTIFDDGGLYTEHLWFFGWLAEGRERDVPGFDEWMDSVELVAIHTDEDEVPPTDPDGSPTP